jgi:hypothetical protein
MGAMRFAGIALICLGTGACAYSPGIVNRAISFNEAIADSTNSEILINALRARDRMPTYYTRVSSDTANSTISPSVSMQIPLGPGANVKGFFPNVSLGTSQQNQLSLQNLDDQKFMRGVLTPVPVDVLGYYLRQGWPAEVLLTVTVAEISVTPSTAKALEDAFDAQCRDEPRTDYCNAVLPDDVPPSASGQYVTQQLKACLADPNDYVKGAGDTLILENYPESGAQMSCFQWMLRVLIALDPMPGKSASYDVVARDIPLGNLKSVATLADLEKSDLVIAPGQGDKVTLCRRNQVSGLRLLRFEGTVAASKDDPSPASADDATGHSGSAIPLMLGKSESPATGCGAVGRATAPQIELTTRSLDGMIYFLGEILRAEEDSSAANGTGSIWAWNRTEGREAEWKLFVTEQGAPPSDSAVDVSFHGETYYIPSDCEDARHCAEADARHRSLQVLSLLGQIWGLQKEEAQLPIVPTVTVVTP